jgi:hypothetical protein
MELKMGRVTLFFLSILIFFTACSTSNESIKPKFDDNLPKITDLKAISEINSIAIEWKLADEFIDGYYIYRGEGDSSKLKRLSKIEDRFTSHYVDSNLKSDTAYRYQISSYLKDVESHPSEPIDVKTLKPMNSVVFLKAIENLPRKVKLIWRPHENPRVKSYIIERRAINTTKWEQIANLDGRLQVEYIDSSLKDNTTYEYRIKVETFDKLISIPSEIVKSTTKALLPMVTNFKASTDKANKIVLSWDKVTSDDVLHYRIYRSDSISKDFKLYKKIDGDNFIDEISTPKAIKFYKIAVVDKDNLEGIVSSTPVMGATLDLPTPPIIINNRVNSNEVSISWSNSDSRAKKYIVTKKETSWGGNSFDFVNIEGNEFIDKDVKAGSEYIYTVKSVDEFGLISEPSVNLHFVIPKEK